MADDEALDRPGPGEGLVPVEVEQSECCEECYFLYRRRNVHPDVGAGRAYTARLNGEIDGPFQLEFEKFPVTGLAKTYCVDRQVPDSASTSTAYLGGVKANYGTIGVDGRVRRDDCSASLNKSAHVSSVADWAIQSGKSAGDPSFRYPALVPLNSETHGGDDVAVFARGPHQHIFTGMYEQNTIPHLIGYAACIGPGATACSLNRQFRRKCKPRS